MILRSFYNGVFSIASKHDFDDQFFLLGTICHKIIIRKIEFHLLIAQLLYKSQVKIKIASSRNIESKLK
jgi:hypothetical protein